MPFAHKFSVASVIVNSGDTLSTVFAWPRSAPLGIIMPALNATSLSIQVGWMPTSDATFVRAQDATTDAEFAISAGSGSIAKDLAEIGWAWPYARIECDTAQVEPRIFGVISKV